MPYNGIDGTWYEPRLKQMPEEPVHRTIPISPLGVIGRDLLEQSGEEKMSDSARDEAKRTTCGAPDSEAIKRRRDGSPKNENTQTTFAVGDVASEKRGTGARANSGKVSFSLVPLHLLAGVARVLMGGKMKYAPWNWAKGMPYSTCFDCAQRHMIKWWYMGEELDAESGEHHLDHAICNLLMLKHYMTSFAEGDDRPPQTVSRFAESLGDFNAPFSEEDYLDRNPAIRERLENGKKEADKHNH